ncbi:MAG: hypothetical protein SFU91_00275 [Chloroherpetonaceae bacterium]|nr:hypothetical protein [Chloroherpetonaceae bacterium]
MLSFFSTHLFLQPKPDETYVSSGDEAISFALWLEVVFNEYPFSLLVSILLVGFGFTYSYILYRRKRRLQKNDQTQARALFYAILTILSLSSTGFSFLLSTLSLVGYFPNELFGTFFWTSWQIGFNGFVGFGFMFGLSYLRTKSSNDIFQITSLFLLMFAIFALYNQVVWGLAFIFADPSIHQAPILPPGFENQFTVISRASNISLLIHFAMWVGFYSFIAWRIFKRSAHYVDESSKTAAQNLSFIFAAISLVGLFLFVLSRLEIDVLIHSTFLIAFLLQIVFYYAVLGMYKHGRYKRV